mmetsp:Transcript_28165/g.74353  ORF Transcript_28165/g.74353 Transcript_28165/m.74353 type:complete len:360 (+) Transcript_28165:175-1254(+)
MYNLVDAHWIEKLRLFIQCTQVDKPGPIDNSNLLVAALKSNELGSANPDCWNGQRLCYDPLDLSNPQPPYVWVTQPDWEYLVSQFGGGPPIRVVPTIQDKSEGCVRIEVNRGSQFKGISYNHHIEGFCEPPVCREAVKIREARELQSRLKYENGTLSIVRQSRGTASSNLAVGATRRLRTRKGETEITVTSTECLKDLKAKIYQALYISPSDQSLSYNGKELTDLDATLEALEIPNGASLQMRVAENEDDQDKTEEREAGFAGSILSGWDPAHLAKGPSSAIAVGDENPCSAPQGGQSARVKEKIPVHAIVIKDDPKESKIYKDTRKDNANGCADTVDLVSDDFEAYVLEAQKQVYSET